MEVLSYSGLHIFMCIDAHKNVHQFYFSAEKISTFFVLLQ